MPDHERAMVAYAHLAAISQEMKQFTGRDKLLVLAAIAACRAAWPDVAEQCRELILENNSIHLLNRYDSFVDAMRAEAFQPFIQQRERRCSYERAEHLLEIQEQPLDEILENYSDSTGEGVKKLLSSMSTNDNDTSA